MRRSQKERQPTRLDISVKECCILYVTEKVPVQDSRVQPMCVSRHPSFAASGSNFHRLCSRVSLFPRLHPVLL